MEILLALLMLFPNPALEPSRGSVKNDCWGRRPTIIGTTGNDIAEVLGTAGNDVIWAKKGDDTIFAGGGNDRICAGSGDDKIFGGEGDFDRVDGMSGNDDCRQAERQRSC